MTKIKHTQLSKLKVITENSDDIYSFILMTMVEKILTKLSWCEFDTIEKAHSARFFIYYCLALIQASLHLKKLRPT